MTLNSERLTQTILLVAPGSTHSGRLKVLSTLQKTGIVEMPETGPDQHGLTTMMRDLPQLVAVVTVGARAHLAVLSACGMPSARVAYQPGTVTRLADGLLLAAAPMDDADRDADKCLLKTLEHALSDFSELAA